MTTKTDPLLQYLLAGARLTGHKVLHPIGGETYLVESRMSDRQYLANRDRNSPLRVRDGWFRSWKRGDPRTLEGLLRTLQPDMVGSRSVQHYIDTGFYLSMTDTMHDHEEAF